MTLFKEKTIDFSWQRIAVTIGIVMLLIAIFFGNLFAYGYMQREKVLPKVQIGNIPVGGMLEEELENTLEQQYRKLVDSGIHLSFQVDEEVKQIVLPTQEATDDYTVEYLTMDVPASVETIMQYKKDTNYIGIGWNAILSHWNKPQLSLGHITLQRELLMELIEEKTKNNEIPGENASVNIHNTLPLYYEITQEKKGMTYNPASVMEGIVASWQILEVPDVLLVYEEVPPTIVIEDVELIEDRLAFVLEQGGLTISYVDPQTEIQRNWELTPRLFSSWIIVEQIEGNGLAFTFDKVKVMSYLEEHIVSSVKKMPQNAKFEIKDSGKVQSFQGSRPGVSVDIIQTTDDIVHAFLQRSWHEEGIVSGVNLVTTQEEPLVKMGEVNDRGISEVLGVGISAYGGSPANRIKNITNAVNKINGILIAPGEEFSTVAYTQPYTLEGGYVPELVIKGNEVKPEIGGGLCQISTTLFRMAMNSGLDITMRRPHGLMVGYYNDLTNGLPGTDATIYQPLPDFRFKNDTNNHILIQAQMDPANARLIFTLWGTSEGKKGWYEPPTVHKWVPVGEKIVRETTNLAPGEERCQHAYTGAETSFMYTRILSTGEKIERVFESVYRAVPETCLVGVEPVAEEPEVVVCDPLEEECTEEIVEDAVLSVEEIIDEE
ncbi:MAG: VanW family protein [Candidatus Magasanikbacteria bacterium]|nr:VanW family protein [Candidatus Magasanikbacteria bacterium]